MGFNFRAFFLCFFQCGSKSTFYVFEVPFGVLLGHFQGLFQVSLEIVKIEVPLTRKPYFYRSGGVQFGTFWQFFLKVTFGKHFFVFFYEFSDILGVRLGACLETIFVFFSGSSIQGAQRVFWGGKSDHFGYRLEASGPDLGVFLQGFGVFWNTIK